MTNKTLTKNMPKMDLFIEALSACGNVSLSCGAAGIQRGTVYVWRDKFATFAARWEDAMEQAVDRLEAEAWKRAIEFDSDRLLMFLLKAHRRGRFGDKVEVKSEGEIKIVFDNDWKKS